MPLYAYDCDYCGEPFALILPVGHTKSVTCPRCKAEARRVRTPFSILGGKRPRTGAFDPCTAESCATPTCPFSGCS